MATSQRSKKSEPNVMGTANTGRPDDHVSSEAAPNEPVLGLLGWLRWTWRQLTSMRTALFLLLLLAAAAIPGSVFPQRSADPNGVTTYFQQNPSSAPILDKFQLFDVYSSAWFSAIYILLFVSLIGCVVPRIGVHAKAIRNPPAATPTKLERMPAFASIQASAARRKTVLADAEEHLKSGGYRVLANAQSVAAERGYWRETGNLIFHISLVGVLISVGVGGAYSYSGQRVLVEGDTFVNNLAGYDSFNPGIAFNESQLTPFSATLQDFAVQYDLMNKTNIGTPLDFRATVSVRQRGDQQASQQVIRVNEPVEVPGSKIYLTGNGYAPVITIRDGEGNVAFSGPVVYLPQDANMTSLGVIKVPDAKPSQFGILSFFYPTVAKLKTGALTSFTPEALDPLVSMNIYKGNLGLDSGIPSNVFSLAVHGLDQLTGGKTGVKSIELRPGQSAELPQGLGTVTFEELRRYAALDIDYNPGQGFVLVFALLALLGLVMSLLIPRRRVWVKVTSSGYQIGSLARGDDPQLERVVSELAKALQSAESPGSKQSNAETKEV